jgi:hypothetical protein
MEDNTALLWYLLSTITEQWAIRGQRMDATIRVVEMIEHAKKQGQTSDTATPLHLAHELVQALASPDRRGLIDALEDIRSKIGETPPTRQQLVEAIDSMYRYAHGEGDAESYLLASRTVRRFLNDPPKESV